MLIWALVIGAIVIAVAAFVRAGWAGDGCGELFDIMRQHDERLTKLERERPSPNPEAEGKL